jgi:uncharacterized GH25 family protein
VRGRLAVLVPALVFAATWVSAHDFWIEPSSFRPDVGSELAVFLRVGMDFAGEPVPRNPALIQKFVLVSGKSEIPIDGLPGTEPAGEVEVPGPGTLWIAFRSGRKPIELEADKFEAYLVEEGLERISQIRRSRGQSGKPGREVFSRSVKSLVSGGGVENAGFDRALGMTLELVPREDPRKVPAGGTLPVVLRFEGKPVEGALVIAMERDAPAEKVRARTDARGEVNLRLPRKGVWLVKAVHMIPAPSGVDADWESLWASLTFENR